MKKLKLFFACLLMAVLSIGQMWAAEELKATLDFTSQTNWNIPTSGTNTESASFTDGNYTIQLAAATNYKLNSGYLILGKSGSTLTLPAFTWNTTKIVVTGNAGASAAVVHNIFVGETAVSTAITGCAESTGSKPAKVNTFEIASAYQAAGNVYVLKVTSAHNIQISKIEIYGEAGGDDPTPVAVTGVTLDQSEAEIEVGGTVTLTPTIVPSNATTKTVTWESSDDAVATVANGVVTGVTEGTATITVKTTDGNKTATCKVTVTAATPAPTDDADVVLDLLDGNWGLPTSGTNTELATFTNSVTGYAIKCSAATNYKVGSDYLIIGKANSYIELPTFSSPVEKIVVVKGNGSQPSTSVVFNIYDGNDAVSTAATGCATDKEFEIENPAANKTYTLKITSGHNLQLSAIKIYFGEAPAVAQPTISGETPFLNTTEVSISIPDGATVYYTTDGSTPSSASEQYSAPFELTNTATVKAIAVKGSDVSAVAEKTFTKATVMTVAQALEAIDALADNGTIENQFVSGVISQIDSYNSTYNSITYWISADGSTTTDQLKIYGGLAGVVKSAFASVDDVAVGDDVTIKGTLKKYKSGTVITPEFDKNNIIEAYKPIARLAWNEDSYEADMSGSNTFPTLSKPDGVTVTYSSTNTDVATINPSTGAISLVAVGSTTIKAAFTGNETYKANEVSYTLNVSNSVLRADISFEENGGSTVTDLTEQSNLPDPLPTITKAGKNFGGWWTTSTFEAGTEAVAGAAVESTDPITLYAKWLEPYTVAEALAIIDALGDNGKTDEVYVQGVVCTAATEIYSSKYLCYYISADGTETTRLYVFDGLNASGVAFTSITDVQVQDAVVIYGKLQKYVKSAVTTPEIAKDNQIYSLSRKADPELAWSETSFDAYIGESNTFPTLTNDHNVAVTYSSTETDYATISNEEGHEGEITLVAVGTTTIKATFAGDKDYKAAEVSYTLNVYNPITAGTITYEENGGSEVADVETPVDNLPDPLPTPTKENNIFAGWWTTSDFQVGTEAVAGAPMNGNITLYAKWTAIPYYATVYTSNVGFVGGGESHEANSKVSIAETEYDAQKVGSSSKGGTITVTVPAKTHTLHFHVFTWKNKSNQITVSGALTNLSASTIDVDGDDAGGGSGTYTIESNPVDHYHVITFDAVEAETEITFTSPASGEQRFIMYGINQEGGVYPVLHHIVITGEATELTYEIGDEFDPAGLGVNAIYTLEEVEQTPVAVDAADIEWSFDPAYIAGETTSVTVTATYNEKSANKTVTGIIVNVPAPEILVNPASVAFGNVNQDDVVEAEVINVTLKSVENATIALTGDVDAFTLDKTALTANGTISVTPVTSVAGTFAATITISDDESAAESKEVALSMTVKAPEIPDVCDGTDDFATIDKTVSPTGYATRTTTDGWVGTNVRFQEIDEKMYWKINGKTTAVGTITSPVLSDGIATLKFRYANTDNESNGVSVKIEIKQSGDVVKEYTLTKANSEVTKDEVYTEIIENINVAGDFQIVFTNLSPSNNSTSNKDRVAIGRLCWTGYVAPEPPVVDYTVVRNDLTVGWYYTMCLDKAVTAVKAGSIWRVLSKAANGTDVILEEVTGTLDAGRPYIFRAAASTLEVAYTGDAVLAPVTEGNNGLVGSFTQELITVSDNNYIIYNNALYFVNSEAYVGANRAYLDMTGVPAYSNEPQQGNAPRRRVTMAVHGPQVATGIDALNTSDAPAKVLINGQLFIIRGEKMFDAKGQLVK